MLSEIAPGVYDITCRDDPGGKRYRVFLLANETPTIFDSGFAETVPTVAEAIDSIGVEPQRLVITHADPDHVGGVDGLMDRYDLELWVPEQSDLDEAGVSSDPTQRYGDGDSIGRFVAVHVPGHAPDNHVLIDESAGIAVMGDSVSGADQRGLPEGYFHLPPAVYSSNLNDAERNLEAVLDFQFDVGLVYHGSSVTGRASEILDRYVNFPGK